jgi:undecaprenyl phosphate-alpha-L-ara4N flippase subunit ArnE
MTQTILGIVLVMICAIIEGFAQIFLKKSALATIGAHYWIAAGVALFVVQAVIYTGALELIDVSTAFPLSGLSFVVVTVLSQFMLAENVTRERWFGVGLILVGAALVAAHAHHA